MSYLHRPTLKPASFFLLHIILFAACVPVGTRPPATETPRVEEPQAVQKPPTPAATFPTTTVVPAFGVLGIIPGGSGSMSSPQVINAVAASGAGYMRANLLWSDSEPKPGQLSFNSPNDTKIQAIEAAGLRLFPTVSVGRGWMNGSRPGFLGGGSESYPPDDLGTVWSDQSGYSPGYYNFIFQFFSHYRGHFDYVAIENEANSNIFWGGTAEEYARLLKTAYKAIKAADPNVKVVDSGYVDLAWGLCIAANYLSTGLKPRSEVVQFATTFTHAETSKLRIQSAADLENLLRRPAIQEQCQKLDYTLNNIGGSVDAINFHYYEDYRVMYYVTDWIRLRIKDAGYRAGIVTNEVGQRGPDLAFAEGSEHAKAVFKKLVTTQVLGLEAVVWFSADTIGSPVAPSPDKVGLIGEGGTLRPAGRTFKLVVDTLSAGYLFQSAQSSGPSLYHYVFVDNQGQPTLEALWSESGSQTLSLKAPEGRAKATVIDFSGQTQVLTVTDGTAILTLTDAPVFVTWT